MPGLLRGEVLAVDIGRFAKKEDSHDVGSCLGYNLVHGLLGRLTGTKASSKKLQVCEATTECSNALIEFPHVGTRNGCLRWWCVVAQFLSCLFIICQLILYATKNKVLGHFRCEITEGNGTENSIRECLVKGFRVGRVCGKEDDMSNIVLHYSGCPLGDLVVNDAIFLAFVEKVIDNNDSNILEGAGGGLHDLVQLRFESLGESRLDTGGALHSKVNHTADVVCPGKDGTVANSHC
ncbi:hypothetical protein HG531_001885 [Fusarium graminearum]|nr:hypothetical protein HG531_001885 [Fusarium graminearum]